MHWDEIERRARDRIGRTLCGKWTLDALLGVGGTSSVYAATHRNGAPLAIKVLHPAVSAIPEIATRFLREGYLANRVRHPAIVGVLDDAVDEVEGVAFLVMERIDGASLAERAAERLFDEEQLLDVAAQTLAALVVAHASSVIHRDLKPENLLVDASGAVRILDFGIARLLDAGDDVSGRTVIGAICGTPGFLAPEQARGDRDAISAKTDLFSLGATLFALASGRPPHLEANEQQELLRAASQQAPCVRQFASTLCPEVAALVDRALRFAPAERWPSATEMLCEVRRLRLARGFARRTLARPRVAGSLSSMPPPPPSSAARSGVREARSAALHDAATLAESCGAIAVVAPTDRARPLVERIYEAAHTGTRGGGRALVSIASIAAIAAIAATVSVAALAWGLIAHGRAESPAEARTDLAVPPPAAVGAVGAVGAVAPVAAAAGIAQLPATAETSEAASVSPVSSAPPRSDVVATAALAPLPATSARAARASGTNAPTAPAAPTAPTTGSRPPPLVAAAPAPVGSTRPPASPAASSGLELRSARADVAADVLPGYRESPY